MNDKKQMRELILTTFNSRYTCKGYDPEKKVSDEDFNVIMEAARLSPSSMGLEPWKFILLNNKGIKERIKPCLGRGSESGRRQPFCADSGKKAARPEKRFGIRRIHDE